MPRSQKTRPPNKPPPLAATEEDYMHLRGAAPGIHHPLAPGVSPEVQNLPRESSVTSHDTSHRQGHLSRAANSRSGSSRSRSTSVPGDSSNRSRSNSNTNAIRPEQNAPNVPSAIANATPGIPLDNLSSPLLLKVVQRQLFQQRLLDVTTFDMLDNNEQQENLRRRQPVPRRRRHHHSRDTTPGMETTVSLGAPSSRTYYPHESGGGGGPIRHAAARQPPTLGPLLEGADSDTRNDFSPSSPDGFYANPANRKSYIRKMQFQLPLAYRVNEETGSARAVSVSNMDSSGSRDSSTMPSTILYGDHCVYQRRQSGSPLFMDSSRVASPLWSTTRPSSNSQHFISFSSSAPNPIGISPQPSTPLIVMDTYSLMCSPRHTSHPTLHAEPFHPLESGKDPLPVPVIHLHSRTQRGAKSSPHTELPASANVKMVFQRAGELPLPQTARVQATASLSTTPHCDISPTHPKRKPSSAGHKSPVHRVQHKSSKNRSKNKDWMGDSANNFFLTPATPSAPFLDNTDHRTPRRGTPRRGEGNDAPSPPPLQSASSVCPSHHGNSSRSQPQPPLNKVEKNRRAPAPAPPVQPVDSWITHRNHRTLDELLDP